MSISNEQLLGFIKKHPLSVGCAVLSLGLAAGIYFRADKIPAERAALEQKSAEGERLAINLKYGNQLKEQFDELTAANQAIESRLVRAGQLGPNSQYFYKLEADTATKLLNLTQLPSTRPGKGAKERFTPVGFTVNVQGNFAQLVDFLRRLENGPHFCRILNASCSKAGSTTDSDLLTLNLSVELLGLP